MKRAIVRFLLPTVIVLIFVMATSCSRNGSEDTSNSPIIPDNAMVTGDTEVNDADRGTDVGADTMVEDKRRAEGKDESMEEVGTFADSKKEDAINPTEVAKEANTLWKFQTGGGIASSPVIMGNLLYFGSKDGNFYAVDKDTGAEAWRYSAGNPILCQSAILDNTVFFSSKEVYFAVDAQTGTEIWKHDLKPEAKYTVRKDQWDYHDSSPVIDHGVVYFGSGTGSILGFEVTSGKVVWEFNTPDSIAVRSTPVIQDGVIYFGDWSGKYRAVDITTKAILWENSYNAGFQNASVIKDEVIFIGGRDTRIYALDITTGDCKWNYKDPFASWISGDPIIDGDLVYFSTSDSKKVYAMNVKDGTVAVEYPIYKNSFSKIIIDNGLLYVTSGDAYRMPGTGKLQVYKLEDNQKCVWEKSLDKGGIFTSPVLVDGIVYFGSEDGYLYAEAVEVEIQ